MEPALEQAAVAFTVNTATAPVLSACPTSQSLNATSGLCGAVVNFTAPTATDNCAGTGNITQTFNYTGTANVAWTVPSGVTSITVDLSGAQGGTGGGASGLLNPGGLGGRQQATLAVSAGQILYINVGGAGGNETTTTAGTGGFNGGGNGGYDNTTYVGGGGGGASDIRLGGTLLSNRIFVAGGGGGGGNDFNTANFERGGVGGAATSLAGSGYYDNILDGSTVYCGMGGTNAAGGASATNCTPLVASGPGVGASACAGFESGGGGGAGYYGGGAGAYCGGGGGSNFATGGATAVTSTPGFRSGNGIVTITYAVTYPLVTQTTGLSSRLNFSRRDNYKHICSYRNFRSKCFMQLYSYCCGQYTTDIYYLSNKSKFNVKWHMYCSSNMDNPNRN